MAKVCLMIVRVRGCAKPGWERDVCMVLVVLMVVVGVVVFMIVVEVVYLGAVVLGCSRVSGISVLGGVFVIVVVEMELVVECVVRLVLWCSNGRGDYLGRFSLMLVEANGLSVGVCLFGMVIWVDYFVLLGNDFLGKIMGARVVIEVVIEVVVLVLWR